MSEGAYRYLRAPTVAHWFQRVLNGIGQYLRVCTCIRWCSLVSVVAYGCLRVTTGT